jgi:hypothetical protein
VNGEVVGGTKGYIDPYEYDVTAHVRPGQPNQILVRVWTPVDYYWKTPALHDQRRIRRGDQKPDDITPLGITRPVRLTASAGPVIRDLAVETRLTGGSAEVAVQLESDGMPPDYRWELTLSPRNFESPERYQVSGPGDAARLAIPVALPHLWWTRDHANPISTPWMCDCSTPRAERWTGDRWPSAFAKSRRSVGISISTAGACSFAGRIIITISFSRRWIEPSTNATWI